jgi:type IV secretion system protein VirB6
MSLTTDIFEQTFLSVNSALNVFVNDFSTNIINEISPAVAVGLTLTFIWQGVAIMRGHSSEPIQDTVWTMFRVSIITLLAMTAGNFQTFIVNSLINVPDTMISAVMSGSLGSASPQAGATAAASFDVILGRGMEVAGQYAEQATWDNFIAPYFYAGLVILGTVFCIIVGAFWVFASKIILSLLLGVAPIFIIALVWQSTQQYFFAWLSAVLNTILTVVFVAGIFSIFGTLFENNLNSLTPMDADKAQLFDTGVTAVLGLLTLAVLIVLPTYVGQLTNAGSGGIFGAIRQIAGSAGRAMEGGRNAANKVSASQAGRSASRNSTANGGTKQEAKAAKNAAYTASRDSYFKARHNRRH